MPNRRKLKEKTGDLYFMVLSCIDPEILVLKVYNRTRFFLSLFGHFGQDLVISLDKVTSTNWAHFFTLIVVHKYFRLQISCKTDTLLQLYYT